MGHVLRNRLAAAAVIALLAGAAVPAGGRPPALRPGEVVLFSSDTGSMNPLPPVGFPIAPGKGFDLYLLSAEGVTRLTDTPGNDQWAVWSPDGRKIAFESSRASELPPYATFDIYVMNADGSDLRRLTTTPGWDAAPSWSPDGSQIAFTSFRGGDPEIYVMDADGSNQRQITAAPGWDFAFGPWCRDGRIVFHSDRADAPVPIEPLPLGRFDVYVMRSDGSDVRRLTAGPGSNEDAVCSPDGRTVAFVSDRSGTRQLYTMSIDGTEVRQVTSGPGEKHRPSWAPDGRRLFFDAERDGQADLYGVNVDGSELTRLTDGSAYSFRPVIRPHRAGHFFPGS